MGLFRSNNHIGSLYWLSINIGWGSESILDDAELEIRLGNILVVNHFRRRSFVVLFRVVSLESRILSKFGFGYTIKCTFHFFCLDNAEHYALYVSFLLGCSGVEAFVVVFFGVDYYLLWTFVFADSESVNPVNRKLAMLCKVEGALLQGDKILVRDN